MSNLKSRKSLYAALVELKEAGICPGVMLPKSGKYQDMSNEVYGRKACIYISFADMEERNKAETALRMRDFHVNPDYCRFSGRCSSEQPTSEISVSYFKGYHWSE